MSENQTLRWRSRSRARRPDDLIQTRAWVVMCSPSTRQQISLWKTRTVPASASATVAAGSTAGAGGAPPQPHPLLRAPVQHRCLRSIINTCYYNLILMFITRLLLCINITLAFWRHNNVIIASLLRHCCVIITNGKSCSNDQWPLLCLCNHEYAARLFQYSVAITHYYLIITMGQLLPITVTFQNLEIKSAEYFQVSFAETVSKIRIRGRILKRLRMEQTQL